MQNPIQRPIHQNQKQNKRQNCILLWIPTIVATVWLSTKHSLIYLYDNFFLFFLVKYLYDKLISDNSTKFNPEKKSNNFQKNK